jgi:glycosyltransferase involved in cell wall biosynthesis
MIGNPENGFQKAMRKVATSGYLDMPCYAGANFNSDLLQTAKSFKPDLIFIQIQQEGILSANTALELSKIAFVINFSGDVRAELPQWYIDIGKNIQLSTFSNMNDVFKCRELGVHSEYLEIGIDPLIYKKRNIPKQSPSIVAHFNHYQNQFPLGQYRVEIAEALSKEFGNEFGVYGHFPNARGNFNHSQIAESENYNRAKIAINCSHFSVERYSSDRLLRAMASGAMVLSHEFEGIEQDYTIGKHLDTFKDIEELIFKCKYYLSCEPLRESIANNGCELIHKNHTFENMCKNIVELYQKEKNGK